MYNQVKINRTKKIIMVVASLLLLGAGFLIGWGSSHAKKTEKQSQVEVVEDSPEEKKKKEQILTNEDVSNFLVIYYTRKDLGENQHRYEPLVTTSMLNELIETENEPVNQAYKGYLVNQVFETADIYVDSIKSTAIAFVTYKNTQRAVKGSDENVLENQTNQEAIKLSFLKQGDKFLVDRMEYVSLSQPLSQPRNSYKTVNETVGIQQIELTPEEIEALDQATNDNEEGITNDSTNQENQ